MEVCCAPRDGVEGRSSPRTPWTTSRTGGVRAVRTDWVLTVSGGERSTVQSPVLTLLSSRQILAESQHDTNSRELSVGVIDHYENIIFKLSDKLHPGNFLLMEVKQKLGLLYGNIYPYTINRYPLPPASYKIYTMSPSDSPDLHERGRLSSARRLWPASPEWSAGCPRGRSLC